MVIAIDDEGPISLIRLFNSKVGLDYLVRQGVPQALVSQLHLLGISGVANLLSAIKFAKHYDLGEKDVVMTVLTDSMEMYQSRLGELTTERGEFSERDAVAAYHQYLLGESTDNMEELTEQSKRRVHNLKYYTWVEQQGKSYDEIQAQWFDDNYWTSIPGYVEELDALIEEFNARTGLLD
jgi:hypothetical protein